MEKNKKFRRCLFCLFLFVLIGYIPVVQAKKKEIKASKNVITLSDSLLPFRGISLDGPVILEYKKVEGDQHICKLEGADNILPLIHFSYNKGILFISFEGEDITIRKKHRPRLTVSSPHLSYLSVNGEGIVSLKDLSVPVFNFKHNGSENIFISGLQTDSLYITMEATGNAELEMIRTNYFSGINTGNGALKLIGVSQEINLGNTGKGVLNASEMTGNKVIAVSRGIGNIYCHAVSLLDATVDSSGDIFYSGHPEVIRNRNGSGRILRDRD